ncbi:MAG: hypothetical protein PHE87_06975 [Victivallaceae bacterium]|nr:hypothetical protein [Victivallaceae bacterium]
MHDSDSTVQRDVEAIIIEELEKSFDKVFKAKEENRIKIGNFSFEVDAVDTEGGLYEIYAHVGKQKPAQRKKIASDLLKLLLIEKKTVKREKYFVIVNDNDIKNELGENSQSWLALAIREFGFNLLAVDLSPDKIKDLKECQKRQDCSLK